MANSHSDHYSFSIIIVLKSIDSAQIEQVWLYWMILVALLFICCCGCFIMECYKGDNIAYSPAQLYGNKNKRQQQIEDEINKLDNYYSNNIQLSFLYYILKFLFYSSTFIEDILVYFYTDYDLYGQATPFYIMWGLSVCMICYCTKWNLCVVSLELTQMILFMMLCNWSLISLIIFGSIFIFQFISQYILCRWNEEAFCNCQDCKDAIDEDDELREEKLREAEKEGERYGESAQFVVFGNLECVPFLYYADNAPFRTLWYELILIWMFWIDSMRFDHKTYLYKYPQYYRPSKHWNHWFIALYLRIYIVSGFGFRFLNIGLCSYYMIFYLDDMSNFEFGYTIFMIAFWGCCISTWTLIIIFWKRFRQTICFGGGCVSFCKWFCCCKVDT